MKYRFFSTAIPIAGRSIPIAWREAGSFFLTTDPKEPIVRVSAANARGSRIAEE
jgi:hypothetical protein